MDMKALRKEHYPDDDAWQRHIEAIAKRVKTSPPYLYQITVGIRNPSPQFCQKLVKAEPRLTLQALRPDIYGNLAVAS